MQYCALTFFIVALIAAVLGEGQGAVRAVCDQPGRRPVAGTESFSDATR